MDDHLHSFACVQSMTASVQPTVPPILNEILLHSWYNKVLIMKSILFIVTWQVTTIYIEIQSAFGEYFLQSQQRGVNLVKG
jgi:hypothetical protein